MQKSNLFPRLFSVVKPFVILLDRLSEIEIQNATKEPIPKKNKLEPVTNVGINAKLSKSAPVICSKCASQIDAEDLTKRSEKESNSNENDSKGNKIHLSTKIVIELKKNTVSLSSYR